MVELGLTVAGVSLIVLLVSLVMRESVERERRLRDEIELDLRRRGEWNA